MKKPGAKPGLTPRVGARQERFEGLRTARRLGARLEGMRAAGAATVLGFSGAKKAKFLSG